MSHQGSIPHTDEDIITSETSVEEIISALAKRGCTDLTSSIDLDACSQIPYAGGGFCDIYRGELNDGTVVAIKSLRVYDGPEADSQRRKLVKHATRELHHWSKLQHPNVLPLMGLALFRGHIGMISEWMDNGSLMLFLRRNPVVDRIVLCMDVCAGLCYIHEHGMAHGDLKAANVLVSSHGVAMIADFGNAQLKDLTLKFTSTKGFGVSLRWTAPELLDGEDGSQPTKEADVYACGMTMLEVLTGEVPFAMKNEREVLSTVLRQKLPPRPGASMEDKMWELMKSCWTWSPTKRPSISIVRDRLQALNPDYKDHVQGGSPSSGIQGPRAKVPHVPLTCTRCSSLVEYLAPSPPLAGTALRIRCYKCSAIITHRIEPSQSQAAANSKPSGTSSPKRKREIGTQERPLEKAYYKILGVEVTATVVDIKKAYKHLAIKHHPDKNRDDPSAEETFKQISIAYQVLSDPELRRKYNEFGPKPGGEMRDPEKIFPAMFGGEEFVPIIGHIAAGKDMKVAQQNEESDDEELATPIQRDAKGREVLSPEEKARREEKRRQKVERDRQAEVAKSKARAERVEVLVAELARKLSIYAESITGHPRYDADVANSWRKICEIEAGQLKTESYGVELLHAIGYVYMSKAEHYFATNQTFMGMGGWLHNIQGGYHVVSETASMIRSVWEFQRALNQVAEAEKTGLSSEEKKKKEDRTAEQGLRAGFKWVKLEIESVLRETCNRVLSDSNLQSRKLHFRAEALQILGEAYLSVQKEDGDRGTGEEKAQLERAANGAR